MLFTHKSGGGANAASAPFQEPFQIRKSPLFRKYFLWLSALILLITTLIGAVLIGIAGTRYKKQELQNLYGNAKNVAGLAGDLLSVAGGGDYLADYENALYIVCYTIMSFSENSECDIFMVNTEGDVMLCKELLDLGSEYVQDQTCTIHSEIKISQEQLEKIRTGEQTAYMGTLSDTDKNTLAIAAAPVYIDGSAHTLSSYVFVTKDTSGLFQDTLSIIRRQFCIYAVLSLALSFAIIYIIIRRFAMPLQDILYATRMYAKGDFSYRITERRGNDEMHELTKAFNSMANDLSAIENSRRNFVANVSHELKTPITTIGGFIDGILDGTIPPSEHKKYLGIVSDEVRRLSRLISSMLNMSKIEAGELTPSYTRFSLSEMIVRTFLSFEQIISQKNITVTGLDELENLTVPADPDMINQVIYNIIDNAVKFTPQDGTISVSCKKEFEKAVMRVRNYGIGIANDDLKLVFDRFYKVDKSRSLNTKSVGLGLYICKNIIELHNGRIYATSEDGKYTEFTIELPLRQD